MVEPDQSGMIGRAELLRIAKLARLRVDEASMERELESVRAVLGHVASLSRVDVDGLEALAHPHEGSGVLGDDEASAALDRDVLGEMAPAWEGGFIVVPKVLGGSPGDRDGEGGSS